jgi:zona occludens toxin (predicted ATPase)
MIRLVTGVPKAGKSYWAVNRIITKYCVPYADTYIPKKNEDGLQYVIITNINGLKVQHESLDVMLGGKSGDEIIEDIGEEKEENIENVVTCVHCKSKDFERKNGKFGPFGKCRSCNKTFSLKNDGGGSHDGSVNGKDIKKVFSKRGLSMIKKKYLDEGKMPVFFIDESQQYFRGNYLDSEVAWWFEVHGHLGLDVYLMAHHVSKVNKEITSLIEYEYRAVPQTYRQGRKFKYLKRQVMPGKAIAGDVFETEYLGKKKEIFSHYKAQEFKASTEGSPFKKYVIIFLVFMIAYWIVFKPWRIFNRYSGDEEATNTYQNKLQAAKIPEENKNEVQRATSMSDTTSSKVSRSSPSSLPASSPAASTSSSSADHSGSENRVSYNNVFMLKRASYYERGGKIWILVDGVFQSKQMLDNQGYRYRIIDTNTGGKNVYVTGGSIEPKQKSFDVVALREEKKHGAE